MKQWLHGPSIQQPIACRLPKSTVAVLVREMFWLLYTSSISRLLNVGKVHGRPPRLDRTPLSLSTVKNHQIADSDMPWHRNAAIGLLALAVGAEANALGFGWVPNCGSFTFRAWGACFLRDCSFAMFPRKSMSFANLHLSRLSNSKKVDRFRATSSCGDLGQMWPRNRMGSSHVYVYTCLPGCWPRRSMQHQAREAIQRNQMETVYTYTYTYFVRTLS